MPDTEQTTTSEKKNYLDLTGLQLYDSLLKDHISKEDAKSIKSVAISPDGKKLRFYKITEPVGETTPAYEFEYPETDLSSVMAKLSGATAGNVLTVGSDGGAVDSGVAINDLAKTSEIETKIGEAIAKATHMKKAIVEDLPAVDTADENTFYLIKDSTVAGNDKYKIYLKIGNVLEMVDDTSVDMSGYYNQEQINGLIATAKSEAISSATTTAAADAQSKADKALGDAKTYTDQQITTTEGKITTLEGKVDTNSSNITTTNTRIDQLQDQVDGIKAITGEGIYSISEEDIRALFN